jgi:tyrosyl-tRNA synthetase
MVIKEDKKERFVIERPEKYGGNIEYGNYEEIERDFREKKLHPLDLKNSFSKEVADLLKKIDKEKLNKLSKKAYDTTS